MRTHSPILPLTTADCPYDAVRMSEKSNMIPLARLKPTYTLQPHAGEDGHTAWPLSSIPSSSISKALDGASKGSISLRSFATAQSRQTAGDCALFKLPAEINYQILSYLSYPEARALNNTCRFFRMYITPDELDRYKTLWVAELLTLDNAGIYIYSPKKPCYSCIRLRLNKAFPRGHALSGSALCSNRKCVECLKKTQRKGETIWMERGSWTMCNWCGRPGKAYRFDGANHERGLCGICGRVRRAAYIWPVVLIHSAELAMSFCCIVWVSWGSMQGWLVGYPDDQDWDKGEAVRIFVIIPLLQLFLTIFYIMIWHNTKDRTSIAAIGIVNFYYAMMAWIWALCEVAAVNPADPREYQLKALVIAAGAVGLGLNLIRLLISFCTKLPITF